jgi:hypothetical protein
MPYALRKKRGHPLYWVVNKITNHKFSNDPLPRHTAEAQMRVLRTVTKYEGGKCLCDLCIYT